MLDDGCDDGGDAPEHEEYHGLETNRAHRSLSGPNLSLVIFQIPSRFRHHHQQHARLHQIMPFTMGVEIESEDSASFPIHVVQPYFPQPSTRLHTSVPAPS